MTYFQADERNCAIDYQQLRRDVSIRQVLQLFDWQPVMTNGSQLRGPCPIHGSTNPHSRSFSVNLEKNAYRCFGCNSQGNQLDLAAAMFGEELYQATLEVCWRLGVEPPRVSRK